MIDGITIKAGDREFIVPPLNFRRIRKLSKEIASLADMKVGAAMNDEQLDTFMAIIHSALTRNYPDLTMDALEDLIDLRNMQEIMKAVMGVSGFVQAGGPVPGE